jgi:hypothetical protein
VRRREIINIKDRYNNNNYKKKERNITRSSLDNYNYDSKKSNTKDNNNDKAKKSISNIKVSSKKSHKHSKILSGGTDHL